MGTTQQATAQEPTIISVRDITMRFPGTLALSGVNLDIRLGEVVALLGENGAGKSTLAKIIAGIQKPSSGTMTSMGQNYSPTSPADAMASRIGMIHQEMQLLPDLTVGENVFVGRWVTGKGGMVDRSAMNKKAAEQLSRLGFTLPMSTLVRDLSVAGQQQVEIARALLLDTKLLILDEPTAALGQEETDALFECIRDLRNRGVSFIYVSHRLAEIAQIADRIVVLRDGVQVAEHESSDVSTDQLVSEMVGRDIDRLFPDLTPPQDEVVLRVENVGANDGYVRDISFDVRAGEVFGIAGLVGAGRTELVRAIAGADSSSTGRVLIDGDPLPAHTVGAAVKRGLVMVPEDRKHQGVIPSMSIQENVAISNYDRVVSGGGWITGDRTRALSDEVISAMSVKGKSDALVSSLSGGNQQKVVIGKWVVRHPKVVILDEPTRGIDVGARAAIYEVIAELGREGIAVVVVSSDLEEVLGLSHRVMVISRGENRGILDISEATAETVMRLATH